MEDLPSGPLALPHGQALKDDLTSEKTILKKVKASDRPKERKRDLKEADGTKKKKLLQNYN